MPKSDINVTPLIDVLLVLLIIFIVVVPRAPRALDATLPSKQDFPVRPVQSLVLEVETDEFRLNATPVSTMRELDERLRAAFETRGDATLFVQAADDVSYARLIDALDTAKGAGATRIGLADHNLK
jgi:biopolymer transport protein TolR